MKKFFVSFCAFFLVFACIVYFVYAQTAPAADAKNKAKDKPSDAKTEKPVVVVAFWAKELPKVTSKKEKYYDINRDEILQTSETKIFLRDVVKEVTDKSNYNVSESILLKAYDKNKDGIISNLEIEEIKKDLAY